LLTVVIIAILTGIVLVAIRPKKNLADAKDAKRRQDLNAMIEALYQYQIDHNRFPVTVGIATLDQQHRDVCTLTGSQLLPCGLVPPPRRLPLGTLIPKYLAKLPRDPEQPGNPAKCTQSFKADDCITGYQLWLDEAGRIHASAPLGDEKQGIELAR
jgi:type II secretory pathway pseudopilin PulG